ncbi:hypothetical protein [Butyrivibrio hungatei]|uniref:Uncharacterized protein n=1 Tax=Butyrivibrio hungatei TaxID=185008 RepID=A0A1D9P5S1_9FIRM|nr:hypothetical protein [Butyrivibrio hungatei]AOZ97928.1 hypothetical protein bhn_II129 [Butyrivibrio hungatei]
MSFSEKCNAIAKCYHDFIALQDDAALRKAGLSLTDWKEIRRLIPLLGTIGNIECTIYEKAAKWFEDHDYLVFDENGIGYRITI